MKLLCISDNTDSLIYSVNAPVRYKDTDLVISAGDLPLRYYDYIQTVLRKDVFYVYGNHNLEGFKGNMGKDFYGSYDTGAVQQSAIDAGFLCDGKIKYYKDYGLIIAGLGGSMRYNNGDSQYTEKEMRRRIRRLVPKMLWYKFKYGRYVDILITHAPPRGIGDREDPCHRGFKCFLTFMDKWSPKYLLHGHVHLDDLNSPRVTEYKDTKVINIYMNYILEDADLGGKKNADDAGSGKR